MTQNEQKNTVSISVRLSQEAHSKLESLVTIHNEPRRCGSPVTKSDVLRHLIEQEHERLGAAA